MRMVSESPIHDKWVSLYEFSHHYCWPRSDYIRTYVKRFPDDLSKRGLKKVKGEWHIHPRKFFDTLKASETK